MAKDSILFRVRAPVVVKRDSKTSEIPLVCMLHVGDQLGPPVALLGGLGS